MSEEALTWGDVREQIERSFAGQLPYGDHDEQLIADAWIRNPRRVMSEVDRLASKQANGEVTYPWRVLSKIAPTIISPVDRDTKADVDAERARALQRALNWVRNAGLHFDRWDDVYDEVFGERGNLRLWKDDNTVVDAIRERWEELRPLGVEVEREAEERGRKYREQREPVPPRPQ